MIAAPLTDLLKNDVFEWTPEATTSFADLKVAMTSAPVLYLPDFSKTFYVETYASDFGVGAVFLQDNRPLVFFSKKLGPRRRMATTYHMELYAIVEAVQKWRQYLLGWEFLIRSDQKSLKELLQQIIQTPDQQLYVCKLMGYKFRIEYKKGAANRVADALSRRVDVAGSLYVVITHAVPHILDTLREETASSEEMLELIDAIQKGTAPSHLSFHDGLVYIKRRIYISP